MSILIWTSCHNLNLSEKVGRKSGRMKEFKKDGNERKRELRAVDMCSQRLKCMHDAVGYFLCGCSCVVVVYVVAAFTFIAFNYPVTIQGPTFSP